MIKMAAGKDQRRKKAAGNAPMTAPSTDLIDSNDSNDLANDDGPSNKDLVRCFCGNDDDFGEMACCDVCSGWFHFRCMRFKENVDLLAQRDFVCCFCLASKTLELLKDVERLQQEIQEIRECSLEAGRQTACKRSGDKVGSSSDERKVRSYSAVVRESPKEKEVKLRKNEERKHAPPPKKNPQRDSSKKQPAENSRKSVGPSAPRAKEFVGRRKLWGTRQTVTEEEIKAVLVSKVPEARGVEVKRMFKSDNGRFRWWFWLYGDEPVLELLDQGTFGVYWKIEKKSPFSDSVVVRVLGR